jgi:hypothetical protein
MEHGQSIPETKCAALWLTAKKIGTCGRRPKHHRGVRDYLNHLIDGLNVGMRDRYRREVGCNGGMCQEFNYSLLAEDFPGTVKPEALRAAIEKYSTRESQEQLALEPVTGVQPAPVDGQTLALPFPKEVAEVHEIPERARRLVEARYRAIELAIEDNWRKWKGQSIHGILVRVKCDFVDVLARDYKLAAHGQACLLDWNVIHAELVQGTRKRARDERLESSFKKRLWSWLRWYTKGKETGAFKFAPGIAALQDAPTANAGKSKLFGEAPRALDFYDGAKNATESERLTPGGKRARYLRFNEKLSAQMTWEILQHEHAELGLPETVSYTAVNRFLNTFPQSVFLYSRDRAKDFHDQCAPYALRDYSTCRVMQGWVLDHGQDDFFVRNDYIEKYDRLTFPELAHGAKLRMWLTAVMDVRSRAILGYAFSANPSSDQICWALRMAVLRTGRAPQFGLIDRGEDFKKVGKDKPKLPREAQGAFLRLVEAAWGESGRITFSIGEHPQSKPIERWYGTKRTRFDSRRPSYCGRNPANRPDRCAVLLKQHEQFLLGKREESPLPPASAAIWDTARWIETSYNSEHRHTGQCMGRRTPEQVFQLGYPDPERQEALAKLDHDVVDVMLRNREARKVFNGGCVRMFGQEYEPDAKSLGRLFARIGQTVLVAADPYLIGDAVAFDPQTGERLGALQCKKLLSWNASKDDIRANMRHQHRAVRVNREYLKQFQGPEQESFRATGTESIRALPPGRPLNFAGAPAVEAAPVITSDFVKKHGAWDVED